MMLRISSSASLAKQGQSRDVCVPSRFPILRAGVLQLLLHPHCLGTAWEA